MNTALFLPSKSAFPSTEIEVYYSTYSNNVIKKRLVYTQITTYKYETQSEETIGVF